MMPSMDTSILRRSEGLLLQAEEKVKDALTDIPEGHELHMLIGDTAEKIGYILGVIEDERISAG